VSLKPDGNGYECDRCGRDCGNGGVVEALVVSDLSWDLKGDANDGHVRNLHFCRDIRDENGKVKERRCASKVISKRNLEHYLARREEEDATADEEATGEDPASGDDPAAAPE
jgi:hypothetical protein